MYVRHIHSTTHVLVPEEVRLGHFIPETGVIQLCNPGTSAKTANTLNCWPSFQPIQTTISNSSRTSYTPFRNPLQRFNQRLTSLQITDFFKTTILFPFHTSPLLIFIYLLEVGWGGRRAVPQCLNGSQRKPSRGSSLLWWGGSQKANLSSQGWHQVPLLMQSPHTACFPSVSYVAQGAGLELVILL